MSGEIVEIFIAANAGATMESVQSVELVPGKGIVGDRYFTGTGTFSTQLCGRPDKDITLIEIEEIGLFNEKHGLSLSSGDFRRNIITNNIRLNELIDKDFTVGNVSLKGIRLCEPCQHLANTVAEQVLPGMIGKAGLRASIVDQGEIRVGNTIKIV